MSHTFFTDGNRGRMVLRPRALFECIAIDGEPTAIRRIEQVAGGSVWAIPDIATDHFCPKRSRFDRVSLAGVYKMRVLNAEQRRVTDIDPVRAILTAEAISFKIAVPDNDRRAGRAAQYAILIVNELHL